MQDGVPDWNGPTIGIKCSDGTRRASAEPESFPLAYGVSNRVGTLRGAGNAIVPQVAAEFIKAFYETTAKCISHSHQLGATTPSGSRKSSTASDISARRGVLIRGICTTLRQR